MVKLTRFQRFANITQKQVSQDHAVAFFGKPRIPEWKEKVALKAPSSVVKHQLNIEKVAFDGDIDHSQLPQAGGVRILHGRQRGQQMDLFIVQSMSYMLEINEASPIQQVCDLIFVVGRGLPVITGSTWKALGGVPRKLAFSQAVCHQAATRLGKVLFRHKGEFRMEHPEVMRALDNCAELPGSKWKVQLDRSKPGKDMEGPPSDTEVVELSDVKSLGHWVIQARMLEKWGCRGFVVRSE